MHFMTMWFLSLSIFAKFINTIIYIYQYSIAFYSWEISMIWINHNLLFIHQWVEFGLFPCLAFLNNATVNIYVQIFLYDYIWSILWGSYLASKLLSHKVTTYSTFWDNTKMFSENAKIHAKMHNFMIPPTEDKGVSFSKSLSLLITSFYLFKWI